MADNNWPNGQPPQHPTTTTFNFQQRFAGPPVQANTQAIEQANEQVSAFQQDVAILEAHTAELEKLEQKQATTTTRIKATTRVYGHVRKLKRINALSVYRDRLAATSKRLDFNGLVFTTQARQAQITNALEGRGRLPTSGLSKEDYKVVFKWFFTHITRLDKIPHVDDDIVKPFYKLVCRIITQYHEYFHDCPDDLKKLRWDKKSFGLKAYMAQLKRETRNWSRTINQANMDAAEDFDVMANNKNDKNVEKFLEREAEEAGDSEEDEASSDDDMHAEPSLC